MVDRRLPHLLDRVASIVDPLEALSVLGHGSLELMDADGVGVVAMSDDAHRVPVFASNERAAVLERLQFGVGEGPCLDAFETGHLVQAGDLGTEQRWPALVSPAVAAGVAAVFAFPMEVDDATVGTIDFHRRNPGPLETRQAADGFEIAAVMGGVVLASADGVADGAVPFGWEQSGQLRQVVHQATGMVSVQAGITVDQALARMRARAWATDRTLIELAEDVVGRRLRFDP